MVKKPLIKSLINAFNGIKSAFLSERNLKIHFFCVFVIVLAGIFLKISLQNWIVISILIAIVLSAELFNTVLEKTIDLISPNHDPTAKMIKDISAGAVLICASISALVGFIIFLPKIAEVVRNL